MLDCDNPFWNFSLTVYDAPGVETECLALQRALNIDVNVLLFVAWLGNAHRAKLTDDNLTTLDARTQTWRDGVVRPLRAIRQGLKPLPAMSDDAVRNLRSDIARAELRAEQIEQAMLFALVPELIDPDLGHGAAPIPIAQAVSHNVASLLQRTLSTGGRNDSQPPGAARLIAEAIAYRPATGQSQDK